MRESGNITLMAVVSVPANYSDVERQAIRDATDIAGINVVRLIKRTYCKRHWLWD